ncbi:unnamed protein product [Lymnaea stagnalis]|uniref:Macro domain-containing protein n=1 Tax=Lymnaea stagnalis TaxID=6523 RepID=A0AAV2IGY4_LYMST
MELAIKNSDLFLCNESISLAHCVSEDLTMGKGIAVEFKKRFGKVEELKQQKAMVGQVAKLKVGDRHVYYLVTKEKHNDKPNITTLKFCLREMRDHCVAHGINELAMPKIGCGLDGLAWEDVQKLIITVFKETNIKVTIYDI